MKNFVCWEPTKVDEYVGNGEEEGTSLDSVLARHVPVSLHRRIRGTQLTSDAPGRTRGYVQATEQEFLESFLEESLPSVVYGLVGESGHGKTHFVHWVYAKLKEREDLALVLLPRTETSLPRIFRRLLAVVPENSRKHFRDIEQQLDGYVEEEVDPSARRIRLLDAMKSALVSGVSVRGVCDQDEKRTYNDLREDGVLHLLLEAQPVADLLRKVGGPIDTTVSESLIGAEVAVDRPAQSDPRAFRADDFPLDAWESEFRVSPALKGAYCAVIALQSNKELLPKLLNLSLRAAVADQMHPLIRNSPEGLLEMIRQRFQEVEPGREIVLLIEELQRTRFIADGLLRACASQATSGAVRQAPMRTLFATTRGVYDDLEESTRQRLQQTYALGLDWMGQGEPWRKFGSTYLGLFRNTQRPCGECTNKENCFAAFGHLDEGGLYPYTTTLLDQVAKACVDRTGSWHPREFLRKIAEDLKEAAAAVTESSHPRENFGFLEGLEEGKVAEVSTFVESLQLGSDTPRTVRALKAYGRGGGDSRRVRPEVARAFGLSEAISTRDHRPSVEVTAESPSLEPDPSAELSGRRSGPARERPSVTTSPAPNGIDREIEDWQIGDGTLTGDSLRGMQEAAHSQLVKSKFHDELSRAPAPFWKRLIAPHSFKFIDGDGGQSIQIQMRAPMNEDANSRATAREAWRIIYEMQKSENLKEVDFSNYLGWPTLGERGALSVDQYIRLSEVQDSVNVELQTQLSSVFGSRAEQAAVLVQGSLKLALDDENEDLDLPARLERQEVLAFLSQEELAVVAKRKNLDNAPKDALRCVGSWKGGGEVQHLDLYLLSDALELMQRLDRELAYELKESQGAPKRYLGRLLDQAKGFLAELRQSYDELERKRQEALRALQEVGVDDWSRAAVDSLGQELRDWRGDRDMGSLEINQLEDMVARLENVADGGMRARCRQSDDLTYEWMVSGSGQDARAEVGAAAEFTRRFSSLLTQMERDYPELDQVEIDIESLQVQLAEIGESVLRDLRDEGGGE